MAVNYKLVQTEPGQTGKSKKCMQSPKKAQRRKPQADDKAATENTDRRPIEMEDRSTVSKLCTQAVGSGAYVHIPG